MIHWLVLLIVVIIKAVQCRYWIDTVECKQKCRCQTYFFRHSDIHLKQPRSHGFPHCLSAQLEELCTNFLISFTQTIRNIILVEGK
jgi:hypothetical protein